MADFPRILLPVLALVALTPFANAAFENVPTAPAVAPGRAEAGFPMVDPAMDDPAKPWSYFTHPVTVIGMPWMSDNAVQVTPEGCINTGEIEFALFTGADAKPMSSRQRAFLDGWIPVVRDAWTDGAIRYEWEAFSVMLDGFDAANTLQFVRLKATNTGATPAPARVAAGCRVNGGPHRERPGSFNPAWTHEVRDDALWREGKLVCAYERPDSWEAVNGTPYVGKFTGAQFGMTERTEAGVARYARVLAPGESAVFTFRIPHHANADAKYLAAMKAADYDACRAKVVSFWKDTLLRHGVIRTPGEPILEQSHRATAVHVLLATRGRDGSRTQTDGLPYPDLFLTAVYDYALLYQNFGIPEYLRENFSHFLAKQQKDGLFVDTALSHGEKIFCGHGQPMAALCDDVLLSGDKEAARRYFPAIRRGVACIMEDSRTQPHGLMRASIPYDNEMIKGQYTCHNYWSLVALRSSIRLARLLGEDAVAAEWLKFYSGYKALVLKAVRESAAPDGYVPTGLYGFITGEAARAGFAEYRTDQDWENEMLLWPTELVEPGDPLVAGTLKRLRDTKYREGIMTYRNGQHLHQYMTSRAANQFLLDGSPREALIDTYHALLHGGPAAESFENMIRPWTDRDVEFCPPPHAWGCSTYNGLVRNLFVAEFGGEGGLYPEKRDILLFNALSPAWLKDGEPTGIERAPTSFGEITALLTPRRGGADIALKAVLRTQPRGLVVRIPYFVELVSFTTDAKESRRDGDVIRLSPDATKLSLEWKLRPDADAGLFGELLLRYRREVGHWQGKRSEMPKAPEGFLTPAEKAKPDRPMSFALVLDAWKTEYARRFAAHVAAGGKVKSFAGVPLQPPSERKIAATRTDNLLFGKPVTCSSATPGHDAKFACDGETEGAYWESTDKNAWWQADLGKPTDIKEVTVIPYFGDSSRYYQFVVKTSLDGVNWQTFLDMSDNTKPLGRAGANYTGQLTTVRHVRVEMLKNSANAGMQLVEVIAK